MRHPVDSLAWKHLDSLYPDFAMEIRNVRLGLASDGFNPFSNMNRKHSTWPVIIAVYNLPPWMCLKQPFLFMSLLIPGPHEPGNDIDVYMQPLIDELKELWEVGVDTYDVFSNQTFNMRAAILWTINDLPAYANLSGWSTSGKLACPHCNHQTCSIRLPNSKKQGFLGSRRFLPIRHRFRYDANLFNGKQENDLPPKPLTGIECLRQLSNLRFTFGKSPPIEPTIGHKKRKNSNISREPKVIGPWKKKSIFFTLPYWQHLLIRHNIDVMHLEKNVSENILGTLLGTSKKAKDGLEARADLESLRIRKALHPIREGNRSYIPPTIFFTTNEEKMLFCKVLSNVRVPDGYSTNISRCVDVKEKKLQGLKSHDHHVIMQHLLPLAIRRVLPRPATLVLLELCSIFRQLCSKKQDVESIDKLKYRIVIALCMMEKMFPPSFFTISVHLIIHLADEVAAAGPVQYRWMYPIERYLQTLKRYVRNKSYPEGCIAVGYLAEECVSFCSMYLTGVENRYNRRGRNADISLPRDDVGGLSIFANSGHHLGKCIEIDLEKKIWEQCRSYILFNCNEVAPYLDKRFGELRKLHQRKTIREVESLRNKEFPTWFRMHDTIDWRVEDIIHIPKIRYTLLKRLSKRIRNNKADLKRKYYTPYVGSPLRFTCGDDRVDSEQWRQMVNYWDNDPKNKIKVEKNIANRKNLKTSHTGGTKSFVRHQADFKERYGHEPDPIETYDLVHRRKDKDRSWVDGASEELGTKLTEELTQLAATHGEVTPELRLQAYISVMGHETNGRVRGYGDLVTPNMVPWVQQTQNVSSIRRSRKGRYYASLESKFLDLQDKYEKQSKKIDELTLMIQSSQRQSSNHVSEQTSSQHRSSSEHWSQESPMQITQHQPNTKQLMATQHQSSPDQDSPSQQNPQHIGTPVQYMPYPQLGPSHFPPSSQLYYPQACHPSLYPQTSYPYGEFTSMLRTDFMQHLMPPRNNQLDQRESSQRDILNS